MAVTPGDGAVREVGASGGEVVRFRRFGAVRFELGGSAHELALFWLDAYGGGVFLPFTDATSGKSAGTIISRSAALVTISTQVPYSGTSSPRKIPGFAVS